MVDLEFFTPAQIAERLKWSERQVRRAIYKYGIPVIGLRRSVRLDARAVALLIEAVRKPCPSGSIDVQTAPTGGSMSLSGKNAYAEARKLLAERLRAKRLQRSKPRSSEPHGTASVVALDPSRKRS